MSNSAVVNSGLVDLSLAEGVLPVLNGGVNQSAWATWTPTWTNITIGNAVVTGRYTQIGKTVHASLDVTFGTTSTTNGSLQSFTLPINARARTLYTTLARGGGLYTGYFIKPVAVYKSPSDVYLGFELSNSAGAGDLMGFTALGWSNGNILSLDFAYEAA